MSLLNIKSRLEKSRTLIPEKLQKSGINSQNKSCKYPRFAFIRCEKEEISRFMEISLMEISPSNRNVSMLLQYAWSAFQAFLQVLFHFRKSPLLTLHIWARVPDPSF